MIKPGDVFGDLTVLSIIKGAKSVHPKARCECRCGGTRVARLSDLRCSKTITCAGCSRRLAWQKRPRNSVDERWLLESDGTYRSNAKRKRLAWELTREQFRGFVRASCHYCGTRRASGIDRLNAGGYVVGNVVSCCAPCNYAKGEMAEPEFLALVERIHRYRCEV